MTESTAMDTSEAAGPRGKLRGLTSEEAARRLREGQGNAAQHDTSRSYSRILFDNAFTPINTILFIIALMLVALGLGTDALFTAGLVIINVVVGVFQEARAKRQLDEIALLARPKARVIRDGEEHEILPEEIVCGDVLKLQPGDQIQVDGSVLEAHGMSVDESLLTGESDLVPKEDGEHVFSGTFCMTGSALFEAVEVGAASMANQITARARLFRSVRTPLQREVSWVIWGMAIYVLILSAPVLKSLDSVYHGYDDVAAAFGHLLHSPLSTQAWERLNDALGEPAFKESVRAAAVIVALVPQGLSFMVTATYAMAAVRIGRRGALVQRLNAVESMSHIDVLCLDKTGTLTTNNLMLEALKPLEASEDELRRLLGVYTASASVSNRTNAAILAGCGGDARAVAGEIGFDSSRKWSALQFEGPALDGVFVLGAAEMIDGALASNAGIREQVDAWSSQGLRVLLFARGDAPAGGLSPEKPVLPAGLHPLGLIALRDELRADAAETISGFAAAGIKLKIISGDNPQTVAALARQAGFGDDLKTVSGAELEGRDEAQMEATVEEATIFGRIAPQHKEALVKALQRRGHYVAMTGDGVNDVPALKQAQLAIAVRSGSPVTRNVADLVLIDDSFGVLPSAFSEGQRIRKGMEGILRLFLVRTFAVSLAILLAALVADPFPITPRQSGVPALLTVGIPALALAVWARPGKTGRFLLPSEALFVIPAAVSIAVVSFALYHGAFQHYDGPGLQDYAQNHAQTVLTLTITLCGIALIPFVQVPHAFWMTLQGLKDDFRTTLLALAMLAVFVVTYMIPPIRHAYELVLLSGAAYVIVVAAVAGWAVAVWGLWQVDWSPVASGVERLVQRLRKRQSQPA
ncbi:MAG TPA: HAD-IC family P-type ATPase [Dehalococcoidia bacterium]